METLNSFHNGIASTARLIVTIFRTSASYQTLAYPPQHILLLHLPYAFAYGLSCFFHLLEMESLL